MKKVLTIYNKKTGDWISSIFITSSDEFTRIDELIHTDVDTILEDTDKEWIDLFMEKDTDPHQYLTKCSNCDGPVLSTDNYCCHCGKMILNKDSLTTPQNN